MNYEAQVKNHPKHETYDVSKKISYTAKAGELLPIYVHEMLPSDRIQLKLYHFMRTAPIDSATFAQLKEHINVYFVPFRLLWRDFNTFFTDMGSENLQSTGIDTQRQVNRTTPFIDPRDLSSYLQSLENNSEKNPFGYLRAPLSRKLLAYLGYHAFGSPSLETIVKGQPLSPFPLLAYQKIYQDHYRNTQWETYDPNSCNIDYLQGGDPVPVTELANVISTENDPREMHMLDLRYSNLPKDLFTSVLPTSQLGNVSLAPIDIDVDTSAPYQTKIGISSTPLETDLHTQTEIKYSVKDGLFYTDLKGVKHTLTADLSSNQLQNQLKSIFDKTLSGLDILKFRLAQAKQRLQEIQISNDKQYSSQIEALFGFSPSKYLDTTSRWLGGIDVNVQINPEINQNLIGNNETTVKGSATSGNYDNEIINFTAPENGILMVIYNSNLQPEYDSVGFDPLTLKTELSDYANPVFDQLGYEALPTDYILDPYLTNVQTLQVPEYLGYSPRYAEYKTNYDIVLGDFSSHMGGNRPQWNTPLTGFSLLKHDGNLLKGNAQLDYWSFKTNPRYLYPLFPLMPDSTVQSDQFLCTTFVECKKLCALNNNFMPY